MARRSRGRRDRGALLAAPPCFVKLKPDSAARLPMREENPKPSREERLAAKLRENLRRRKAQARNLADGDQGALPKADSSS
jgi:hypothetical protein